MRKMTLREIRGYIAAGAAVDISNYAFKAVQELQASENGFDKIGYSTGLYGINGGIAQGRTSGQLYAIKSRSAALFQIF